MFLENANIRLSLPEEVTPTFVQRQTIINGVGGVGLIRSADTRSDNVVIGKECSLQYCHCEDNLQSDKCIV
mgnify:CR=1 FL=1